MASKALVPNSKAVPRAYAKRALVKISSLEEYEQRAVLADCHHDAAGDTN